MPGIIGRTKDSITGIGKAIGRIGSRNNGDVQDTVNDPEYNPLHKGGRKKKNKKSKRINKKFGGKTKKK